MVELGGVPYFPPVAIQRIDADQQLLSSKIQGTIKGDVDMQE